jgi:dolichol-phosphate mannosyltransferase
MKLSVVIPAYNEAESLPETLTAIFEELQAEQIPHEILVVNDNSRDNTLEVLDELKEKMTSLTYVTNTPPNGFGLAVRKGLDHFSGDCVAIMMADLSDSPKDLVRFYRAMAEGGYDCVFGSRFMKGGEVIDYPKVKLYLNRLVNTGVKWVFRLKYNDCTNAFKLYSRNTIDGLRPFLSPHFNLTLEMPLKAIVRGYSYTVLPNSWRNRKYGESKLKIKEMGSRYFFIFLYCLIEKYFSRNDYVKKEEKKV